MNFSDFKAQVYSYLGFKGMGASDDTDALIEECLTEIERCAQFNYLYRAYDELPAFLNKEPYRSFLSGTKGAIVSVMTLGAWVDRLISRASRADMARAAVLDAVSSAYLELKSDEYERTLGDDLSYRFCPGYGGSSVEDLKEIFALLHPEKIGVTLSESNFMLPSKSMAGVIGIGTQRKRRCGDCFMLAHCKFREDGRTCFHSGKM